jgi:hypothetical protein
MKIVVTLSTITKIATLTLLIGLIAGLYFGY